MMSSKYHFCAIKEIAQNWLLDVLLACYLSAQEFKQKLNKFGKDAYESEGIVFYSNDRLINANSDLTINEILLAKGHEELQHLPFLTYCLLQSDALRPSSTREGSYTPSVDAKCAASANMSQMSPSTLSRSLAPRLELWNEGRSTNEASVDFLNLNMKDILDEVQSSRSYNNSGHQGALLFLDSPRQIVICDSFVIGSEWRLQSEEDIPEKLRVAVQEAKGSYRVSPSHIVSVGENSNSNLDTIAISERASDSSEAMTHLRDAFVEDSKLHGRTYSEWMDYIAEQLFR